MASDRNYTAGECWLVLDVLLQCQSKEEFDRETHKLATHLGVELSALDRYWWGLATGVQTRPPRPTDNAPRWAGTPFTWAEVEFIAKGTYTDSKEAAEKRTARETAGITEEMRMAACLQRSVAETEQIIMKHGPAQGRVGFGL